MRITLDARMMGPENTRGIGRSIAELVRSMLRAAPQHRYALLARKPELSPFLGHPSVEHIGADFGWYGPAEQLALPPLIRRTRPDIFHAPHWNVPVLSRVPRIVTIHDLILLEEPLSANATTRGPAVAAVKRLGYRVSLHDALFRSRRILVPTEFVADWIKRRFPRLTTPIDVTGEGMPTVKSQIPNPKSQTSSKSPDWSEPDLNQPYLLYVGSAYPHKNLERLLEAWKIIAQRHAALTLVLAGERDVFMRRLEERVKASGHTQVRFFGRVSDEELSRLYEQALAFVFPSRLEGFGLPPLEALAHGCPVAASDIPVCARF